MSKTSPAYLPHQPKIFIHFRLHGVDLCEDRVFESPQNLMDSAAHEQLDAQAVHVHRDNSFKEEGVGVQLVHHRLRKTMTVEKQSQER